MTESDIVERLRSYPRVVRPHGDTALMREAADEIEQLRRWKGEALIVLEDWEKVWEAAGRPGAWGSSKAVSTREHVERISSATHQDQG